MVKQCANPVHDVIMLLMAHDIRDWRHFLNRGVAHISLMEMATGIDPATVTFVVDPWDSEHIPYLLHRYGFKNVMTRTELSTEEFSAARIVLAQAVPIVHPSYFHRFLDRLKFNFSSEGADKVVLVSRAAYDHVEQTRVIANQHDLEMALKERYGGRFEVFKGGTSIHRAISVFQNAAIVIGSHGEAMYNTLWASRNCRIVEILPVRKDGGYPDQGKPTEPPKFEHLSFYTMSMMNFQRFYRYYSPSRTINYEINVPKFMRWVGKVFPLPAS
jgi:capsular polysaccharide biosynthesis protein